MFTSRQLHREKLDYYQPVEQAVFKKGYICDYLIIMRILIEKSIEHNFLFRMAFVDYEMILLNTGR